MYNRKFDMHRDFHELVDLEHEIMPIVRKIEDKSEQEKLISYIMKTFDNQWKK